MPAVTLKLRPIMPPNFVMAEAPPGRREDGLRELPKFAISELDDQTLEDLVKQFRIDLFGKAGRPVP